VIIGGERIEDGAVDRKDGVEEYGNLVAFYFWAFLSNIWCFERLGCIWEDVQRGFSFT